MFFFHCEKIRRSYSGIQRHVKQYADVANSRSLHVARSDWLVEIHLLFNNLNRNQSYDTSFILLHLCLGINFCYIFMVTCFARSRMVRMLAFFFLTIRVGFESQDGRFIKDVTF